ncbi:aldose epimerase family protein [Prevotella sp. kh1p2]|uniref:aldose epimerase family protein n=1 Tax=Prevotella sp. kh1p2 TaxID=1761883 RepID=UPI0008CF073B|nr:aldose epimerase family protein [Prevotella sp. kh1p2]SET08029.1 aldose 1-epimerase [Prevotella sp. kh1p2]SNU10954.1 aldose 1-epimerase [Prevotellaceae bacterium KH2P17]
MKNLTLIAGLAMLMLSACTQNKNLTESGLDPAAFDTTINEKPVQLYTLKNSKGMEVSITNFGGRVVSIMVPDKNNHPTDVVLGYDNIAQYADSVNSPSDFGAAIGRYANRINKGQITVGGKLIQLPTNNYGHCLHGGPSGWQYQVYDGKQLNDTTLQLTLLSPDGDNNFPGNVTAHVTYTVKSDNTLDMRFEATTDKETVVNMTNHSYFNLNGDPSKPGTDMVLYINADRFTPADATYMTTGEILPVQNTPMDFRKAHALNETINDTTFQQIKNATGYDHNWVLNTYKDGKGDDTTVAASLYSPGTGILLEMFTNEPGVQVYTGNFLGSGVKGKKGIAYPRQASVCLESQKYPDSPNKKNWPSPYLKPGEKYYSHVAYKFSVK